MPSKFTAASRCKFLWMDRPIRFYNKSIMERLCTVNTAALSTRTHLAEKPSQKTLNHVFTFRVYSRSRVLVSLKSRRGTVYNCLIMWALESEISMEMSMSISVFENPTVIRHPYLGNPCEYSHIPHVYIETRIIDLHFVIDSTYVQVYLHSIFFWLAP